MNKGMANKLMIGLALLVALAVAIMFVFASTSKAYLNQGPGMQPTISDGEKVRGRAVPANKVNRGDIIVFNKNGRRLIKRVVGLPGDTVSISNGELIVNRTDGMLYKPYNDTDTPGKGSRVVSANSFYVVGDNRADSLDSRTEGFGLVPFDQLLAVVKK